MPKKGWCVVELRGNKGNKVLDLLKKLIEINGLNEYVSNVLMCKERYNYIFIKMLKEEELIRLIKGINGIRDFLRVDGEIIELNEEEVLNMI